MAEQRHGNMTEVDTTENDTQGKEIYTYHAPWTVFAMAWSHRLVVRVTDMFLFRLFLLKNRRVFL
jgi:hypothetical protein